MMHNFDQNGMMNDTLRNDKLHEAVKDRWLTHLPPSRRKVIIIRCSGIVLTGLGRMLIWSGRHLQNRASDLSTLLDTTLEAETPVQQI